MSFSGKGDPVRVGEYWGKPDGETWCVFAASLQEGEAQPGELHFDAYTYDGFYKGRYTHQELEELGFKPTEPEKEET
jgi:hypothetical protein